jgi:hypothetical protein
MSTQETATIKGKNIFFNFIEVPIEKLSESGHLVKQVKSKEIDGFVVRNVLSAQEVNDVLAALQKPLDELALATPSGKNFPAPFAIMTDSGERLDAYFKSLDTLNEWKTCNPALKLVHDRMDIFFKSVGKDYEVSIPINKIKGQHVSAGCYRQFFKGKGGLYVHCGNLFQQQTEHYYSLLVNDIDMNDQLSFFLKLQNSEEGGELTIYDMLWEDFVAKSSQAENETVIDAKGNTIYLKDVEQFTVQPLAGDVLIFAGGPIWHRVEDIRGDTSRITYGGFLNFSKNEKELFYWA